MAKITITLFFIITCTFCSFAQAVTNDKPIPVDDEGIPATRDTTYNPDDKICEDADHSAEFPGGTVALYEFIAANIVYPQVDKESGIQGTVYVSFVVEKSGRVNHIKILRGIGGFCDEEVIRVFKAMPRWKAAMKKDKPVRTGYNMPVKFTLSDH